MVDLCSQSCFVLSPLPEDQKSLFRAIPKSQKHLLERGVGPQDAGQPVRGSFTCNFLVLFLRQKRNTLSGSRGEADFIKGGVFLRIHGSNFRRGFLPAVWSHPLSDGRPQLASCFSLTNGNFTVLRRASIQSRDRCRCQPS